MSKKSVSQKKDPPKKIGRGLTKRIVVLAFCVVATVTALSRWEPARRTHRLSPTLTSTPQQAGGLKLAKEYIYAGGRLIATEEPTPAPTPTPTPSAGTIPTNFVAAAGVGGINMSWAHPATGTIDHYVIERKGSDGVVLLTGTSSPTFVDPTATQTNVYRYRVQALFTNGISSAYSNGDIATRFIFQDDPVMRRVTPIRALHINQLRQTVEDVHMAAGLGPVPWSVAAPASGSDIKAKHVEELQTYLEAARAALELPPPTYTLTKAALLGDVVRAVHINDLRRGFK